TPPQLTPAASEELMRYGFPGNIRELENILERALALSTSQEIGSEDLRLTPPQAVAGERAESSSGEALPDYLDGLEREAILDALSKTGFNRTAAAKLLGITFRQLRYRVQQRAWHAGASCWRGRSRCNDFSVGVELEGVEESAFEDIQYARLNELLRALRSSLPLSDVAAHSDVAPDRKTDPGAHFDWARLLADLAR